VSVGSLVLGGLWLRIEAAGFHRVWETLKAQKTVQPQPLPFPVMVGAGPP
jgi:hypothetical protein